MTIWIDTNGRPSEGANKLAKLRGFKRNRTSRYIRERDVVVNWGSSRPPTIYRNPRRILNRHHAIELAANKLSTLEKLAEIGISCVSFTVDPVEALQWSVNGCTVVARKVLTGHSGNGIVIMEPKTTEIVEAPLYTKYIFKVREYRVHVVGGKVIDTQQKIRDPEREPTTWKIRSHANGFIFARENVAASESCDQLAIDACTALGLDFGAVDIIEDKNGVFYVLEINTSPGLEGQTITKYAEAFLATAAV